MKIGKTYKLTAQGISTLMLLNSANVRQISFDKDTTVTVVGPLQECECGSKIDRHTDNCPVQYIRVDLPSGDYFMACKDDLQE